MSIHKKGKQNKTAFTKKWSLSFADEMIFQKESSFRGLFRKKSTSLDGGNFERFTDFSWRIVPFYIILAGIFVGILFRAWQLQVVSGNRYRVLAEENRIRFQISDAPRGTIYDRNGEILARNIPGLKVYFTPYELDEGEKETVIATLSEILHEDRGSLVSLIEEGEKKSIDNIIVKSNIDHETEIELLTRKSELSGVSIDEGIIREYLNGEVFSHIIGYTGELSQEEYDSDDFQEYFLGEKVGRAGLEQSYEGQLKGAVGQRLIEVDAVGNEKEVIFESKGAAGKGLVLSIDAKLQTKVDELIKEGIKEYNATGAVAVFQEVNSGRILSLISLPSFDNNLFSKGATDAQLQDVYTNPSKLLFNRAITGTYPAGSTIKPLVGAAALEEGVISADTLFNDTGVITIGEYRFPDWKIAWGLAPNGPINVIDAISQSCDTFFYAIGGGYAAQKGLGIERLQKYGKLFGLGSITNIDLPGESSGLYPDPDWKLETTGVNWYLGDTYWVSIGQSYVLTTPLQINNYITAVANGGILYKPQVVDRVVSISKETIEVFPKVILNQNFISETSLDIVREGMIEGVSEGIIYSFRGAKYQVAAKTGTAEFGEKDAQGYYDTHAWVTGFFPVEDPQISFTILFESGGKSSNAADVMRKIIDWYYEEYK